MDSNMIYLSEEYKEFLIDTLSNLHNPHFYDEIDTKKAMHYIYVGFKNTEHTITYDIFEKEAINIFNSQVCPKHFDNTALEVSLYLCGIIGVTYKHPHMILIKTREQLQNILDVIKANDENNCLTYIDIFKQEHSNEILRRKKINEKQREDDRIKREYKKKLLEEELLKNIKRQAIKELIEEGLIFNEIKSDESKREPIPQDVSDRVWNRDGGKCVKCGSQENLEFDHIIPFSKGGATTYRNLQLLCQNCNRSKSDNIG
ncbi:MAG: HNH endonuclease [Candidatus Azobacteroides sp.]|nr:HNH endonuclease [Candidatus Azobacteroides sp.]